MRTAGSALVALSLSIPSVLGSRFAPRDNGTMHYSYDDIQPSRDLQWTPCFDDFACAMLEVPLDYEDESAGFTGVAFIKYSSANDSAEDVVFNPGGPGESGVSFLLNTATKVLLPKLGPYYNFVSFDPRGVNNSRTGVSLECFPGNAQAMLAWNEEYFRQPIDTTSRASIYDAWAKAGGWGERCTAVQAAENKSQYANTVAVAHDMLRYAELRAQDRGLEPSEAKLWYYGFSYGTVLGATYATLFPDRIGRMVLDAVADSEAYYGGRWEGSFVDTDAAVKWFFKTCYEAGPEQCQFFGNATSAEDLETRFFQIHDSLRNNPIVSSDPEVASIPTILGVPELKSLFFQASYNPNQQFPAIARLLDELEHGNTTTFETISTKPSRQMPVLPTDDSYVGDAPRTQILCMDSDGRSGISTVEDFEAHAQALFSESFFGAETMAVIMGVACRSYGVSPPSSQSFHGTVSANQTSAPILFVGNTMDPATPLASAKKMSRRFPGSGVLAINAAGHGSTSVVSECADREINAYFADTTLPSDGKTCEVDVVPFSVTE